MSYRSLIYLPPRAWTEYTRTAVKRWLKLILDLLWNNFCSFTPTALLRFFFSLFRLVLPEEERKTTINKTLKDLCWVKSLKSKLVVLIFKSKPIYISCPHVVIHLSCSLKVLFIINISVFKWIVDNWDLMQCVWLMLWSQIYLIFCVWRSPHLN